MRPSPGRRGDPVWLPEVLREFGVNVIEDKGWKLWGMGDFGTIWGVMAHHTGANNTSTQFIRYNPMLSNALSSQIHLSRSGVVTLVGAGIAWHAGVGSYPGIATNAANQVTIGIEAQGDGQTWPAAQMDAYHRTCAAICWYLGLPASRVIAHHEWGGRAQGKWDPGLNGRPMPMGPFRDRVQQLINQGPKPGAPAPAPIPEEDVMAADLNTIITTDTGEEHRAQDLIKWTDGRVYELTREGGRLDKLEAKIDRLLTEKEK